MEANDCLAYIEAHKQELHDLILQLAHIPAPTGKEERRARFCRDWLENHGADGVYTDQAGNVIYPYHVSHDKQQLAVFDAHMDIVFPDETELPLSERDGRIYCPGVEDDTANLAVLLMAASYAAQYQPETGEYGILFVCGVGEEGLGNLKGARELCARFGERIAVFYALDLTMGTYTCRAVGSLRYRVEAAAPGGHSYLDFGRTNANAVLADIVCSLYKTKVPTRGRTTYNVGLISGGTSVNTIAQRAELLYEIRSDEERDLQEMEQLFAQTMDRCRAECPEDAQITVELIGERPCEHNVNEEKRGWMFQQIERVVETAAGTAPVPVPCSTDCNIPLSMGIPSVCIGTCRGAGAHTREEYIEKDSPVQGLQIVLQLVKGVKNLFQLPE